MPRSPAGPGRPFCASDRGTPDAKQVKIESYRSRLFRRKRGSYSFIETIEKTDEHVVNV